MTERVLITGGAGLIGRAVVERSTRELAEHGLILGRRP
jgi:nucleoside-diphosphate-sugar epimerase